MLCGARVSLSQSESARNASIVLGSRVRGLGGENRLNSELWMPAGFQLSDCSPQTACYPRLGVRSRFPLVGFR